MGIASPEVFDIFRQSFRPIRYKRLAGKSSWFRGSRGGGGATMMMRKQEAEEAKEAEGGTKRDRHVMFVSHTPGDLLAKNL